MGGNRCPEANSKAPAEAFGGHEEKVLGPAACHDGIDGRGTVSFTGADAAGGRHR
jgi:hypothetical protein